MSDERKECCRECRFYHGSNRLPEGFCRRFPPSVMIQRNECEDCWEAKSEYPIVRNKDWCGEFRRKKNSTAG